MYLLAILSGILTAVMVLLNGTLSSLYGNYPSSVLIHGIGLISVLLYFLIIRYKFKFKKKVPWYLYLGGVVGVLNVVFCNLTVITIGSAATTAIGLLGQTVTSLTIDTFGLMGFEKVRFNPKKSIGLLLILAGILLVFFEN